MTAKLVQRCCPGSSVHRPANGPSQPHLCDEISDLAIQAHNTVCHGSVPSTVILRADKLRYREAEVYLALRSVGRHSEQAGMELRDRRSNRH